MGKRNVIVLSSSSSSSSDNEDVNNNHSRSANSISSKSRAKSRRSLPLLNKKKKKSSSGGGGGGGGGGSKRSRRLPDSRSLFSTDSLRTAEVDFDSFCEGFYEGFQGLTEVPVKDKDLQFHTGIIFMALEYSLQEDQHPLITAIDILLVEHLKSSASKSVLHHCFPRIPRVN
ncbi:hypothetical protein BVC80_1689g24 [Macleaya cordata]|uniref:Uncharacterized protein n=1 Tax=Macleaya cordata TaxID=56857 RepID=A0A200RAY9_MACCD|nr:hypothetical protein BVC80_1689g24 [Macleaya cordata]